ncbi:MAG: chain-length determining protein [Bacteroidaceae bacterium]|nr:chain-length determining protein [Bacteroidaceae bacterium]
MSAENHYNDQQVENRNNEQLQKEASPVGFMKIYKDLLKHRRLYYKVLPVTFILAVIYTLSLPNYYCCTVKLSPEMSSSRASSGLMSLASSFGFNMSKGTGGMGTEALFPTLYPDLVNSTDFKVSLFPVPVTIEGNKEKGIKDRTMPYYDYLVNEQKKPWFSVILGAPRKLIGLALSLFKSQSSDGSLQKETIDPFRLTKKQAMVVKAINKKITCDVDKKMMVITIKVTDQNPVIAATMADTVKTRLQKSITDYRTSKVRVDMEYYEKINAEAKIRYEEARQKYSEFVDANQYIILQTVRQKQVDLENEMQLQYNAYMQTAQQLLAAEAKVQEETPAFTTLQSATVPVRKAGPARSKMCLMFLFLAFIGTSVWILHKEGDLLSLFTSNDEEEPDTSDTTQQTALIQTLLSLNAKK